MNQFHCQRGSWVLFHLSEPEGNGGDTERRMLLDTPDLLNGCSI